MAAKKDTAPKTAAPAADKKGTVKPLDPSEVIKPAAAAEAPAAPAAKTTGSEVDLDIMVDE